MADPPVSRLRRSVGLALLLLLLGGAGPVFASHLPAGPARLFEPAPAAVGSASLLALYFLAAWPWLARRRDPAVVLGEGIAALSIGLPFLVGPALVAGVPPAAILSAAAVIAGCALVGAAFLLGPGRRGGGERAFVAFVAGAVAAAPLVNYAANEFLRAPGGLAYRISPPLVIRRILLERPDADPRTFLLGCLACAALLLLPRLLRPGAASLLLLCAAPVARAAPEAENLFGEAWAPGRVLPLRVAAKEAGEVTIPGLGRFRGGAEGGRALLFVPGPATPAAVLPGSPVEGGLPLVLCLAPPSDDLRAAAREGRLALTSARPGWERLPQEAFLSVDAVYDPAGALPEAGSSRIAAAGVPVLRAFDVEALAAARTALRRPWEEPGREFSDQDLRRLFAPAPGPPEDRAVRSLGVLAAFSVAAFAAVRFARGRGRRGLAPVLLVVLGVAAVLALRAALPGLPDATHEVFTAREGTREVSLHRAAARRETMFRAVLPFAPVVLGPGAFEAGRLAGGSFEV
ncbi:MAG: hypothetical protein MUE73_04935, partial [Planctomycetes bacterium]|nr:hypothetical protein [Planctomycetota bacterium]